MSRKYRQRGYQDSDGETRSRGRRVPRASREGPRSPRMTAFEQTFRCGMCGYTLPPTFDEIVPTSECPECSADLHTCKNCVFFDPASRFECSQPIPERVAPKDERNECELFEARTTVEKSTGEKTTSAPRSAGHDPRAAFERLFKK